MADAALHSSYIGRLHCLSSSLPAAGSCRYAAAGSVADQPRHMAHRTLDTVALHLHRIAAAELWYYSSTTQAAPCVGVEVPVEKKIK